MKKQISKDNIFKFLFYALSFAGIYCLVFSISPLSDDWHYLTSPHPDFNLKSLLPGDEFWRPFDALFGGLMGLFPGLFPALNRVVVVAGHVINALLVGSITKKIGVDLKWSRFAVCFFMFSSAVWAVVVSPDALNQAFSVLFGLVAIWLHLKKGGYYYLILCMIALLWKESGVSWFFVIPIFDAFLCEKTWAGFCKNSQAVKKFIRQVVFSLLSVAVYFAARFALYGEIALGNSSGTYKLSIFSFSTIKNAVLLFASGATGVDAIALFGKERSIALVVVTVLLSAAFLVYFAVYAVHLIFKKKQIFTALCLAVCVAGLALPLMVIGSAGEMHAYPVLCGMAILLSFCLSQSDVSFKKMIIPVICIFISFGISSTHKLVSIYDYSEATEKLTQSIMENYDSPDEKTLFVTVGNWDGYSVFTQSAIMGTYKAYSVRQYFNWKDVDHEQYDAENIADSQEYIKAHYDEYDKIFIIEDETANRIK